MEYLLTEMKGLYENGFGLVMNFWMIIHVWKEMIMMIYDDLSIL